MDITAGNDFLGLHDKKKKIQNRAHVYMIFFFLTDLRKSSPSVISINHESPCIFHIYRLWLPVSTWLCCLLLYSVTSCASIRVKVTGTLLLFLVSKFFTRRLWTLHPVAIPMATPDDTIHKQTHMQLEFEPTMPLSDRQNKTHALDSAVLLLAGASYT